MVICEFVGMLQCLVIVSLYIPSQICVASHFHLLDIANLFSEKQMHLERTQLRVQTFTSSSRMRVIYHNWSATKQRPHPQSEAETSHHSVLSGDRIRQCETSSGSRHKDTDQCL